MNQKFSCICVICLLGVIFAAGCASNDNGPSTQRSSTDQVLTPTQRAAIQNNPKIPAKVKALELGFNPGGSTANLPPQYRKGLNPQTK